MDADKTLAQIRKECLASGKLWEDPKFPATDQSLFYSQAPPERFVWLRPHEISSNPQMFDEGASRFDIAQGALGDCWLLASLACLSMHKELLHKVVPPTQSFEKSKGYCGAFAFYFWRAGEWKEIVVDDRLPTYNRRLVFTHSNSVDEFWSALVEKAYAKIFGTFESLKGGNMSEALEDFTGGLTEPYELPKAPADLFSIMVKAMERESMMGCSIPPVPGQIESELPNGLICGHAYSITKVKTIKHKGAPLEMVRIRNPWGTGEWKGAWSDNSPELKNLTDAERRALELSLEDDGEFWMTYQDFKTHYKNVEICMLSPDATEEKTAVQEKKKWLTTVDQSAWRVGSTAGGCRNNKDTFHKNPQFFLTLEEADDDDCMEGCSCIVALYQKNTRTGRSAGKTPLTIGFAIYNISDEYKKDPRSEYQPGKPLPQRFFLTRQSTAKSPSYINSREIVGRFKLPKGDYVIVPTTFRANEGGDFMLRIYSEKRADGNSLDESTEYTPGVKPLTDSEKGQYADLKKKFAQIAGEDLEVDAFELYDLLNSTALLQDVKSESFSLDACRSMVAIYDSDMSGKLGFKEFTELWVYICTCKKVFLAFDTDKSGNFSTFEMQDALKFLGFTLDRVTFASIVTRFGDRNHLVDFNQFLNIACKLRSAFERFEARKTGKKSATIALEDWIQLNIYS